MSRPVESSKRNRLRRVRSGLLVSSNSVVHSTELISPKNAKRLNRIILRSPWDDYLSIQQLDQCIVAKHKTHYFRVVNIRQLDGVDVLELSRTLSALQHANIASLYDIYRYEDEVFLVAEHLHICISELGMSDGMREWEIATIFSEVLKGISHIASLNFSCKDITSEHIRLSLDGEVKLALSPCDIEHDPLYEGPRVSQVLLDFPILAEIIEDMMLSRYHITSEDEKWSKDALEFLSCALSGTLESLSNHRFLDLAVSPRRLIPRIRCFYQSSPNYKPLLQQLPHESETWKIGDWVYVPTASGAAEPVIAQVYRAWEAVDGQKWIGVLCHHLRQAANVDEVCDSEVIRTGQCHDYKVEQVLDRCVVRSFAAHQPEGSVDEELYSSSE